MSLILRWFDANGERHRAYFREQEPTGERRLVIAARDWECTAPDPHVARLEDLSEDALVDLARDLRSGRRDADDSPAFGD